MLPEIPEPAHLKAQRLNEFYGEADAARIIAVSLQEFGTGLAAVSSFGADSAILLHLIAQVQPSLPVLFLQTNKHFTATLRYQAQLVQELGLTDVRDLLPDVSALKTHDPLGALCLTDKDRCCDLRKTQPLALGVAPFQAWFTGRKQSQAATRNSLPAFEAVGQHIRINPLKDWGTEQLEAYREAHHLPPHPLVEQGYRSIGCMPCTRAVSDGEDQRAGRWAGSVKTECGIHLNGLEQHLQHNGIKGAGA
ncbi:phosphoadenylyl-sulfate reductase [Pseudochrobactrum sp. sp1633]|uniref:phosphoadenylyl-sulfate reductase n=1 Tax=Pseudochrobactrum sp. sp1633 TaxID=3036706 RepID=UPI0025A4EF57|nr:phosphoadenylyl-sulfate reductase [Pseudochrobactrum sp. sp1633]MDM8344338.1 phosphoadenylyl-sulfate reductase [Pseudochrobactrum sp. sp1633]